MGNAVLSAIAAPKNPTNIPALNFPATADIAAKPATIAKKYPTTFISIELPSIPESFFNAPAKILTDNAKPTNVRTPTLKSLANFFNSTAISTKDCSITIIVNMFSKMLLSICILLRSFNVSAIIPTAAAISIMTLPTDDKDFSFPKSFSKRVIAPIIIIISPAKAPMEILTLINCDESMVDISFNDAAKIPIATATSRTLDNDFVCFFSFPNIIPTIPPLPIFLSVELTVLIRSPIFEQILISFIPNAVIATVKPIAAIFPASRFERNVFNLLPKDSTESPEISNCFAANGTLSPRTVTISLEPSVTETPLLPLPKRPRIQSFRYNIFSAIKLITDEIFLVTSNLFANS